MKSIIELANVSREYARSGDTPVYALKNITFSIAAGEFVVIRGPSGSGKSSLLNILGCLDQPSDGHYRLLGEEVTGCSDKRLSQIRNANIGFVFQAFHLLPRTTAVENVQLPFVYRRAALDNLKAVQVLERVGLGHRLEHYPTELSGGEQQRVAIARALITEPPLILADEPTGNLDQAAGKAVMELICGLNEEGRTIVLVTHDDTVAAYARREISLLDGNVRSDRLQPHRI